MSKIAILGAGAMGSALTKPLVKNGHDVNLWGTELDDEIINNLKNGGVHLKHKINLPKEVNLFYSNDLEQAVKDVDLIIMAITSEGLAKIFKRVIPFLKPNMIIGSVSKGFEYNKDNKIIILPDKLEEMLPVELKDKINFVVVGGPCKAIEVLWEAPSSVTYSSNNIESAITMKNLLVTDCYNIEANTDVIGTEICAAMKNAYAISLGMAEGFKKINGDLHNNTKAALFTFAVFEMSALVEAMGGEIKSVIGLPGVGDLEVTGEAGRNRILGEVLGSGVKASEAIRQMKEDDITVEGYPAIKFGYELAKQLQEEGKISLEKLPLLTALYNILYCDADTYESIKVVCQKCTGYYI